MAPPTGRRPVAVVLLALLVAACGGDGNGDGGGDGPSGEAVTAGLVTVSGAWIRPTHR